MMTIDVEQADDGRGALTMAARSIFGSFIVPYRCPYWY